MNNVSIIIPSLNPNENLVDLVKLIISKGFKSIIIVNDGSNIESEKYFNDVEEFKECTILKHYKNLGKGRALKTAFNYYLNTYIDSIGVLTVDSDSQHHIDDIYNCAVALQNNFNSLILGCRNFNLKNVPFKSRFGNLITKFVFNTLCGIKVSDTQTGLRGIPRGLVEKFLDLDGERYEYETNMLIETKRKNVDIQEIKIKTIYIDNNKSSHFNPLKDSLKIYLLIVKFLSASIISALIDLTFFTILMLIFKESQLSTRILISTVTARILSSLFNYFVNKDVVFKSNTNIKSTMVKYYTLAIFQMCLSFWGVYLITSLININTTIIKIVVDLILFIISFQIQREWVFKY